MNNNLFLEFYEKNKANFNVNPKDEVSQFTLEARSNHQIFKRDVSALKSIEGDIIERTVVSKGSIIIKAGVFREGHSFKWIYEHKISNLQSSNNSKQATTPKSEAVQLDLSDVANGTLEIWVIAEEPTTIFIDNYEVLSPAKINQQNILYKFISPSFDLCSELEIYYHITNGGYYSFESNTITLYENSVLDLGTYFNSFSAIKWHEYTNIRNLEVYFEVQGACEVELVHVTETETKILNKCLIKNNPKRNTFVTSTIIPDDGLLALRIIARENCVFYGGGFCSNDPKIQKIKLGIGITTFKREQAVTKAVARLAKAISSNDYFKDKIAITVVDNGQTLSKNDLKGATLIPNRNLGGSGGFMRNLIHYKDEGSFTHCMFMDDDASCEAESIFRSFTFIEHCTQANSAISGAMLSENIKFEQWENGAWFDNSCRPMHCNLDLRKTENLITNEKNVAPIPTYGAWWFFLFPIKSVEYFSFPFFVRGDDVEFSYVNKFNIIRMNGICTWQEDFKIKESPMTLYLDMRSHIMHHLLLSHKNYKLGNTIQMMYMFFNWNNYGYKYDTAYMITQAIKDVLKGPKFWEENLETTEIRKYVKENCLVEKDIPLQNNWEEIPYANRNLKTKLWPKFMRKITLNGHLIPSFMISHKKERISKYETPNPDRMYMRSSLLVFNPVTHTEYILKRDFIYFMKNYLTMKYLILKFALKYSSLKKKYRKYYEENYKTENKWNEYFNHKA